MKITFTLILLWFLFPSLLVRGQSYDFTHYQVENGLSNNAVVCSAIDSRGFMWFGTKDGLNRFDGYTFKVFRNVESESRSLGSNFISALCADSKGNLWVGTEGGLYQYDVENEKFVFIDRSPRQSVSNIAVDSARNVWFVSGLVIYKYNAQTRRLNNYKKQLRASAVGLSSSGEVWASTWGGFLHRYDAGTDSFTVSGVFKKIPRLNPITKIVADGSDKLLIGTPNGGAFIFDIKTKQLNAIPVTNADGSPLFVRDFKRTKNGELWIATESGIFIYDEQHKRTINLVKSYNDPYSIADNAVYTFCMDREGGIWAGTYFGGANYYAAQHTTFEKYFPKTGQNAISGNAIREICADKNGNLWIGTEDAGLNKFNPRTGVFTNFKPGPGSISNTNVHGLIVNNNELWIGTFEHGLDVMDLRTEKVVRHYTAGAKPGKFRNNFIHSMYKSRSGTIYVGTPDGMYAYDPLKNAFHQVKEVPAKAFCSTITEDSQGTIWVGTFRHGVYYFNPGKGIKGHIAQIRTLKTDLSQIRITSLFEDSNNDIWIATEAGLYKYMPRSGKTVQYSIDKGLPSNIIYNLLEDSTKHLWISTSKGLVCFDMRNETIKVYTRANGLLNDQFNYCSAYKDSSGKMYFGSVKGMISFRPESIKASAFVPPVYITGFQVNNKELQVGAANSPLAKSILVTKALVLDHRSSSFSIDFSALSYSSPATTEYAYKMDGLDYQWTYIKTNRRAYFTELPAGKYTFKVKAANAQGKWSKHETSLHIRVLPPFWKSSVAYMLYVLAAMVMVIWLVRRYNLRLQAKHNRQREIFENEKEKEVYQAKIEFFTNVAHEIRTPLTLIKGPMEKLLKRAEEVPGMEKNLNIMHRNTERLLMLTNQLLDFRKTESSGFSLNFVKVNMNQMLNEISQSFQAAAEEQGMSFKIDVPAKTVFAYIDPEAITKIVSNLLDNAIKYGKSIIEIKLSPVAPHADQIFIEVRSNGRQITADLQEKIFEPFFRVRDGSKKHGTGIGLSISRALAELHKGSLKMAVPQNDFNIFVLTLPIHQLFEFNLNGRWRKR